MLEETSVFNNQDHIVNAVDLLLSCRFAHSY